MNFIADFLEPRSVQSHSTVIIPLYKRVAFVRFVHGSKFFSRFSKISRPLDAITGSQFQMGCGGPVRAMASWRDLSRELHRLLPAFCMLTPRLENFYRLTFGQRCDLRRSAARRISRTLTSVLGSVIDLSCVRAYSWRRSIDVVTQRASLSKADEEESLFTVVELSRATRHIAASQRQYLTEHIHFVTYHGKQILMLDVSHCSASEVGTIVRAVPEFVNTRPRRSVLILSDFTGAAFDLEAVRVMKETAVFNKPYVKKSAWVGTTSLPQESAKNVSSFSRRQFTVFETRKEALAWLLKD
jgi:hypothetical protein